jgi:hypothetical protein
MKKNNNKFWKILPYIWIIILITITVIYIIIQLTTYIISPNECTGCWQFWNFILWFMIDIITLFVLLPIIATCYIVSIFHVINLYNSNNKKIPWRKLKK